MKKSASTFQNPVDWPMWIAVVVLSLVGVWVSLSAGYVLSLQGDGGVVRREAIVQIGMLLFSIVLSFFLIRWNEEKWRKAIPYALGSTVLMLLAVPFVGKSLGGAKRWLEIGSITVQPSEFMKAALILTLAAYLSRRKPWKEPKLPKRADWAQKLDLLIVPQALRFCVAIPFLAIVLLVERQPNLGTAAILIMIITAMFIVSGSRLRSNVIALAVLGMGAYVGINQEGYRANRVQEHALRWEESNLDSIGYQTTQSEIALASSGLTGVGFGSGRLPHMISAATDDFAAITFSEEAGLFGGVFVIGLLGFVVYRLWRMAQRTTSRFGMLVCMGTASWFTIQGCTNLLMANGTLPPIGIPFPFVSAGGSSLISLWVALAMSQSLAVVNVEQEESSEHHRIGWWNRRAHFPSS